MRHAQYMTQYMTWPRGMAVAETAWSAKSAKSWKNFAQRVEKHFHRLDASDINYARSMYDVIFKPRRDKKGHLLIELATELEGLTIHYTFEGANPDQHYPIYSGTMPVPKNAADLRVITCRAVKPIGKMINMPIAELEKRAKK